VTATRALRWLRRLEDALLSALVLILVGLAGAQILLRDLFATGLSFADPLMRSLVLWTGMLGALAAVRDERHIALDVLPRFLSPRVQRGVRIATFAFAAALCALMAWYSFALVRIDFAGGGATAASAAVPPWVAEAILPVAFALMALRFALRACAPPAHAPVLLHDPGAPRA
jgi:TRAP-type C4-dicarboxylate transport system permease small subunit